MIRASYQDLRYFRVLAPPSIQYKASKVVQIRPNQPGSWRPSGNRVNISTKRDLSRNELILFQDLYMDGQNLDVYAVLDLAPPRPGQGAQLTEVQFSQLIKGFHKVGNEVRFFETC